MSTARKQLQDIYDSGAKTLTELQDHALKTFQDSREKHAHSMQDLSEKSSISLQKSFNDLQADLKSLVHKSLDRLENLLLEESNQNEAFALSLIDELQIRTEQMKTKLSALSQSHQENVDFASGVARHNYLSSLEIAKVNLNDTANETATGLIGYGNTVADKLVKTVEESFWQQHKQCQQTCDSFFVTAREQEKAVTDHASILIQTLVSGCQNKLSTAKMSAAQAAEDVQSSIQSLLETVSKHANHIEVETNDKYIKLTDSHFQKVDARLNQFADELSDLHDGVTNSLLKETENLSADLLSSSTQAQEKLRTNCDQAVNNIDYDYTSFKDRLSKRLQLSRGQKQTLEEDKNKILLAIKNELVSTHDLFAKKISTLLTDAKSSLTKMTDSVEEKILAAMETCNKQIEDSAASAQTQIEDEVTAFLQELLNSRKAAVDEISASEQSGLPNPSQPSISQEELPIVETSISSSAINPWQQMEQSTNLQVDDRLDGNNDIQSKTSSSDSKQDAKRYRKRKNESAKEIQGNN